MMIRLSLAGLVLMFNSFIKFDAIEIPLKQSRRVPKIIHQRALLRLDNIKLGRLDKPWNTPTSEEGTIKIFLFY